MTTARSRAIARQDEQIQQNVANIQATRRPPSALALMASRLGVSEGNLQNTLKATVFKNCSDAEFVALVIVANEYKLNPLTKEIYAFAAKGGGIVPLVSIDGWVRIMNEHPQFDGIEFEDIVDEKGKVYAIESTIYRRDRTRPIKVTEYMEECKRNTDPWSKTPNRMLRHRALIQGARYAFGFSGIYADDEVEVQMIGDPVDARNITPPTRAELADHDPETGEVVEEGRADEDHGDQFDGSNDGDPGPQPEGERDDEAPYAATVNDLIERLNTASTFIDAKAAEGDWQKHMGALPDAENQRVDDAVKAALARLGK